MYKILSSLRAWILAVAAFALQTATASASETMTLSAPHLFTISLPGGIDLPFSNSTVMLVLAVLVISVTVWLGTRKMELVPRGLQNVLEAGYELLYNFLESVIGPRLTKRYFWYFGTVFILILCSNYMGLLPGVGIFTVVASGGETEVAFRGANADMNTTMFLGLFFALLWFVWSLREQGLKHFILHIFGPKGGVKGIFGICLIPIFLFVGLIDCLSIAIRPIALAARLFGNIYAGESIIETMGHGNVFLSALSVLCFMAMELLVGFIQALVFVLLTAVFLKLQVGEGRPDPEEEETAAQASKSAQALEEGHADALDAPNP